MPLYYFCVFIASQVTPFKRNINCILAYTPLILISILLGLRDDTGIDDGAYAYYFSQIAIGVENFETTKFERGYYLLNTLVMSFFDNYNIIFLISSVLAAATFIFLCEKLAVINPIVPSFAYIALTIISNHYSAVRGALSVGLMYLAVAYYTSNFKKTVFYIITIFIAAQFHTVAYFGLLSLSFFIALKYFGTRKFFIIFILGMIGLILFKEYIFSLPEMGDALKYAENYLELDTTTVNFMFWLTIDLGLLYMISYYSQDTNKRLFFSAFVISHAFTMFIMPGMYIMWMRYSYLALIVAIAYMTSLNFRKEISIIIFLLSLLYYSRNIESNGMDLLDFKLLNFGII